jgi:CxxC motif-containing protein (DUF1111 family)
VAQEAVIGDALPGTDATKFNSAKNVFTKSLSNSDGLGPLFNGYGCVACHGSGSIGGGGNTTEARFGKLTNGLFDAMESIGGPIRQSTGIGGFNIGGLNCQSGHDDNPPVGATLFANRLTSPLFGLGLVDSLPDARFDTLASREPAAIRGIVNRVRIVLANPLDPSQVVGGTRVARFGWKAARPSLAEFAADAARTELGLTSSSCNAGVPNLTFALENRPNQSPSNAVINGCPEDTIPGTDLDFVVQSQQCRRDPATGASGSINKLDPTIELLTFFSAHLAPPTPVPISPNTAAARGQALFNSASLGCSGCHRTDADVFVSTSAGGVPAGIVFAPYSDFLVHDMGSLGDQMGNTGDSVAVTRRMRTAPLWGLRVRNNLLHDGRTTDRAAAITAHAGQGATASAAFNALTSQDKNDLLQFLGTL